MKRGVEGERGEERGVGERGEERSGWERGERSG